ncbi:efflux RND transporter periplasmic adaptor subunit [Dickeya dadantii]|uniref:efflux RND transporter periplasmic adaptor subunit n=1 Tax=Dickeya dadantii TaxID=204038 RepID=UPI0003AB23A9|nr:HlyD family efflux transporter periplasmic adaptor subunit [Dickeya dadantii]UAY97217.1 HlyD family efflux transporter periplasmic adaptor subunit [Dickeya dadantii]
MNNTIPAQGNNNTAPLGQLALPALKLLQFEAAIRKLADERIMKAHIANAVRQLLPYEQAIVWQRNQFSGKLRVVQISDVKGVERKAPLLLALERFLNKKGQALEACRVLNLQQSPEAELKNYPLQHGLWLPLGYREQPEAGVLYLRSEQDFNEAEQSLALRLSETYTHAWLALRREPRLSQGTRLLRHCLWLVPAILAAGGFIPVPLSVVAPVEVIAREPYRLTAPIDGVVRQILVAPNSQVASGTSLVQFEDLKPYNEMVLAGQELAVAEAHSGQVNASAFEDEKFRQEMAVASTEYLLARGRYQYMTDIYQRTKAVAPQSGIAIYTNKRDWEGKTVRVGEEIMQVADPRKIQYQIALPVNDSIHLKAGDRIRIFLDSSPLKSYNATLTTFSYTPQVTPEGVSSYTLLAEADSDDVYPRIGARGTARIYTEEVPLWFQLLRRPIASARQFLGV